MILVGSFASPYIPGVRYIGSSGVFRKGMEFYNRRQYGEAVNYFRRAADGGNTPAMSNLGLLYEEGKGVPKDEAKAVELYTRAMNDEDNPESQAMVNLGIMYLDGRGGLQKDEHKAVELFRKAADGDNLNGMVMLGAMYQDGEGGLPKDRTQAVNWYKKSADKGNEYAKKLLKELQTSGLTGQK